LATKDYAITTALAVRDIVGWTSRGEESLKHSGITITKPGLIKSFAESKSAKQGLMEFSQRINKLGTEKGIHIHNVASVAPYIKDYARYVEAKTNYSVALKKFVDATFKRQSNGNWSAEDSQRIESIYAFHARYSSEIISLALRGASFEKPEIQTALAEAARINRERAELGRSWIISNIEGKAEEDKLEQVLLESKVNPSAQQLYNQRVQRFMRLAFPAIIIPITLAYPIAGVYGLVMFLAGLTKINPVAGINALATWRAKSGIRAVDKREAGNVVEIAQRLNLRHSRLEPRDVSQPNR
jgi:hypothetical protein